MARGGKREGAGRPVGAITERTRKIAEGALAEGITPLDYMLGQLRDETNSKAERMDAAKAAAPYVHAKLANVDANVNANVDGSITFTWLPPS
jgi:hypothetical protein